MTITSYTQWVLLDTLVHFAKLGEPCVDLRRDGRYKQSIATLINRGYIVEGWKREPFCARGVQVEGPSLQKQHEAEQADLARKHLWHHRITPEGQKAYEAFSLPLSRDDLIVGHTYRCKNYKAFPFGGNNDRWIRYIGPDVVQYDSDTVKIGQLRPCVPIMQFLFWAVKDVTHLYEESV